ncbi:MAG: DNA repair protein [Clostridia bacterium]|nr:DNA repair protein [Clostridia bacterium]
MDEQKRTYFCIDMKSFYASVECAERGLNPFETSLAVADMTRGSNALCLAISPKMKALGVKNRCRLSEIPAGIKYEVVPPRMALYIDYAADIYSVYLDYFSPSDIHVYSIDESFLDVTAYLDLYRKTPVEMAKLLMNEIASRCGIPSTAGIGTNLYLAKVALDITAKHSRDHIGCLDESKYRLELWDHRPITDFWMVAGGTARRLERYGVYDMRGVTELPTELVYKVFGKNAELLIDHAWGREPCLISDIKSYKSRSHSVSFSQILPRDYTCKEARVVMQEMAVNGAEELMRRKVITNKLTVFIGYSRDLIPPGNGSLRLLSATSLASFLRTAALEIYDRIVSKDAAVRRLGISFDDVVDEGCEGYDLFTDPHSAEKERAVQRAKIFVHEKYGKNSVLTGTNYLPGGTQRERNGFIGGHRAGYDDETGKS